MIVHIFRFTNVFDIRNEMSLCIDLIFHWYFVIRYSTGKYRGTTCILNKAIAFY